MIAAGSGFTLGTLFLQIVTMEGVRPEGKAKKKEKQCVPFGAFPFEWRRPRGGLRGSRATKIRSLLARSEKIHGVLLLIGFRAPWKSC